MVRMKKLLLFLIMLSFPAGILAYSEKIIPGGQTLGIDINTDGIIIVGFYKVNDKSINDHLRIGDRILKISDQTVKSVEDLVSLIEDNIDNDQVEITYKRNNKEYKTNLDLVYSEDTYKTGLYIKGNIAGIGTLSYIDPETKVYGILGHVINESKTNSKVEVRDGNTYLSKVKSFTRSVNGNPGSKNATILKNYPFGSIVKNTNYGVYGKVYDINKSETIDIANLSETHTGKAWIRTTNLNDEIVDYEINILAIDNKNDDKNFYFEIVDDDLLKMSGGVVQGMSGSPILQDDKIIGAVTRVLIDDVRKGYGISIITMLEEGDKIN